MLKLFLMNLRRRGLVLVLFAATAGCATRPAAIPRRPAVPAEALTDSSTVRARCVDPEGVLAGRVFCVLRDLPHAP